MLKDISRKKYYWKTVCANSSHHFFKKKLFDISDKNKSKFKICLKTSKCYAITKAEWQKMKDAAGKLSYLS